ncbi:MAG: hypothetical protein ACE5IA_05190 [Dehalococcoidia bacterium]
MGEIKSAFEKAMERADRLGRESPEERELRKRQSLTAQAEGLARRYLNIPSYNSQELKRDLDRLEGDARGPVASEVLSIFLEAVSPLADNERLLQGILAAGGDEHQIEGLRRLCAEFIEIREQRHSSIEGKLGQLKREELGRLGISGPAICFDVESGEEWQQAQGELEAEFARRKKELFG